MKQGFFAPVWRLAVVFVVLSLGVLSARFAAGETAVAPPLEAADQYLLAIPKSGFDKDYLFSASMIPQDGSPTSHGLAGKIVQFKLFPDGVDMYESTKGLVVTEDLPARRLLASFPIIRQDANQVVIDFNKGMRQLYTQSWTDGGSSMDVAQLNTMLEVPDSRVFSIHLEGDNLTIRQSVQARSRESDQDVETRYEMRYFIAPYHPGNYQGKEPNKVDDRYARFFESPGQLELNTGRISSRIDRFDLKTPIQFYYSANTPPEYVQAVKDAIEYWNIVFQKEVVKAAAAPAGVTAPSAKYNIVQWVPWDRAGFAYADVLNDPLTGESKHGQAYITSAFTFLGKARARVLLRAMEEIAAPKQDGKKTAAVQLGVPFLNSAECCDEDRQVFARQMAMGLQELLASDQLTDAAALRVSQDYLRQTVAHEVGHILGLRHNFAGSLAATLSAKGLDDWFKAYLLGDSLDAYTNKLVSSSVMEYNVFKASVFIGWQIGTLKKALPHDRAAMLWGYYNNPEVRTNKMLFATDEDIARYGDVRTFDYGRDPVVGDYEAAANLINLLPNTIIETFIAARAPQNPNDRVPLAQVNLNYKLTAGQLADELASSLTWFNSATRSLRVENQFDYIGDLNQKERYAAHWKYLNTQIKKLGGVDRALFSDLPDDFKLDLKTEPAGMEIVPRLNATNLTARLEQLLNSTNYQTFVGLDDKKYSFTKAEHALILKRGKKYFNELEKEFVKQTCLKLENAPRDLGVEAAADETASEDDITAQLENRIIEIAKYVVTATSETNRIAGKVDKGYVEVPVFKYDQATRLAAAKMLNEKTGSFNGWADDAKSDLNGQLKKQIEDSLNISHFKDFQVSLLSRPLRDWYEQQQEILALLPVAPPKPGAANPPPLPAK